MTGTFKFQKTCLRAERYNIEKVSDPLFILDTSKKSYLLLDEDMYQQLQKEELRLQLFTDCVARTRQLVY